MTAAEAILLGVVQGLTEFLPVSSSGHLVLGRSLLGDAAPSDVLFEVVLHGGTLLAVAVAFRREIGELLRSLAPGGDARKRRLAGWLALASVPTAAMGLAFRSQVHRLFAAPAIAAGMLLVTGLLLWLAHGGGKRAGRGLEAVGAGTSLVVGVAQGCALVPGISRAGATVSAAMLLGVNAEDAARFSFLLSMPAVAGALALELIASPELTGSAWGAYLLGGAAAFASGVAAIRFFLGALRRGWLRGFAVYCWVVGLGYLLLAT